VQSVQDWNNSVPLVKDKKTIVRAHFQLSEPATLSPRLRGFRNEAELPGGPLVPDNPGGRVPVSDNAALLRGSLNQVARFTLPKDWAHGDVVLEVDGGGQPVQCLEQSPPGTPDCQIEVSFESVAYPNIEFVDFKWTQGGTTHQVTKNQARELVRRMLAAYPIAHSNWGYKSLQWSAAWGLPPSKDRFGRVLAGLQTLRKRDNCSVAVGCNQLYYGVIRTNSLEGEADDIISSVAVGFVPSSPRAPGRQTHSHEVGHMLGLHHSVDGSQGLDDKGRKQGYCDEVADSLAPDFPWFFEIAGLKRPTLGPMDAGQQALVYGFDSDLGLIVDPEQDFDMMGYCANAPIDFWPSAHTYTTLRDNINLQFGELDQAVFRGPTGDYQLFRGLVDLDTMAVELLSTVVLEDVAPPDNPPAGDFTLRLRESGGAIIDEISFAVEPYQARGAQGAVGGFIIAVPFNAAINAFEIEHNSIVIASLSASDNAPTVSVVYPVGGETISSESIELQWTANDIDGDSLSFAVQYSDDNGASWNTIAEDRVQETLVIDRSQLPASGTALWRVGVSDGFLAGSDTSGTFTVSNNAPSIFVDDPAGGLLFSEGQSILFEASAIDPEDGPLDGSGFTWTSDIDGMLGSGNPLAVEVASLQDGEHSVTVRVEDSGALAGQDQVTIRVAQTAPAELSDLAVTWLDDGSFEEPGPVTVRAQVVNYGTESANNVTLQFDKLDGIPGEAIIGSVNPPPGWVCDGLSCSTTSLGLDQPAEFTLHLNLVFGNLLLSATAASDAVDPATGNNSAVMGVGLLPDFDQLLRSSFE
jgi:hypothetical protein